MSPDRPVVVRRLTADDAAAFQALRLQGLQESSSAFASSFEEEVDVPLAVVSSRLGNPAGAVFGAFLDASLVGIVGVYRQPHRKSAHRAHLWGMYVAPVVRQRGVARELVAQALRFAARTLGAEVVTLGVNAENQAALALYRRFGFVEFGRERDFLRIDGVRHDELHLSCELGARGVADE